MRWSEGVFMGSFPLVAFTGLGGCRAPTQVELEIVTDVACSELQFTEVAVGPLGPLETAPPATVTTQCSPSGRVGSLVVVPEGAKDDLVAIKVVSAFGPDTTDCSAPYAPGCIVARRALKFLPHETLKLEVQMRAVCAGIPCEATETCRDGLCVDASVDTSSCREGTCGEAALGEARANEVPGCGDRRGLATDSPWPSEDYCPTRVGRIPWVPQQPRREWWTHPEGTGTAVLTASRLALFPLRGSGFVAVDATTGSPTWRFDTDAQADGGTLLRDGGVVFGTQGGGLHVLDAQTGIERWEADLGDGGAFKKEHLTVLGGGAIVTLRGGQLVARAPGDGAVLWERSFPGSLSAVTLGADGWLYLAGSDVVRKVRPSTGEVVQDLAARPGPLAVAGRYLLTHRSFGPQYAFDLELGREIWSFAGLGGGVCGLPAVSEDGIVLVRDCAGTVAVDAATGEQRWTYAGGSYMEGFVTGDGRVLGASLAPYGVVLLDRSDGTVQWQYELPASPDFRPSLSPEGVLYVSTRQGGMRAYGP